MKITIKYVPAFIFLLLCSCAVPSRSAILSALKKSDFKTAVGAAKNDGRSSRFLAQEILVRAAGEKDIRTALVSLLKGAGREVMPVLGVLKDGKDPVVKAVALMKLHSFGRGWALDALEPLLDSDEGLVKAAAVEAFLAEDQGYSFYGKFIEDPEVEVRLAVVRHLASSDYPWKQDMLYDAAKKDPEARVRALALRALDSKVERNLELLKTAALGEDPPIAMAALAALVRNPDTAGLPWLENFLAPPVTAQGIYYAAALLAAGRSKSAATDYLKEALYSESPTLRQKLLGALNMAGTHLDGIKTLAEDKSPEVLLAFCVYARKMGYVAEKRAGILTSLAERSDDVAVRALVALSEEKSVGYGKIRGRIWRAFKNGDAGCKKYLLSFVGLSMADPPLAVQAMADGDPEIRLHAAAAYLRAE
jgi:hypothetical protein